MLIFSLFLGCCSAFQFYWEFWYVSELSGRTIIMGIAGLTRRPLVGLWFYLPGHLIEKVVDLKTIAVSLFLYFVSFFAISFHRHSLACFAHWPSSSCRLWSLLQCSYHPFFKVWNKSELFRNPRKVICILINIQLNQLRLPLTNLNDQSQARKARRWWLNFTSDLWQNFHGDSAITWDRDPEL